MVPDKHKPSIPLVYTFSKWQSNQYSVHKK